MPTECLGDGDREVRVEKCFSTCSNECDHFSSSQAFMIRVKLCIKFCHACNAQIVFMVTTDVPHYIQV